MSRPVISTTVVMAGLAAMAGEISATNLHLRLSETAHVDEMAELAASFNQMLDRLDELIMDARKEVLRSHPEYQIHLKMDESLDDEDYITIRGNSYLLTVAFANIMDNACKFSSDHRVEIFLAYDRAVSGPVISFTDQGLGIPAN